MKFKEIRNIAGKGLAGLLIVSMPFLLMGCKKEAKKLPRLGNTLKFKKFVDMDEFRKAKPIHDVTGDGIGDMYTIDNHGTIGVLAGRRHGPGGKEPHSYEPIGTLGPIPGIAFPRGETQPSYKILRARGKAYDSENPLELLIPCGSGKEAIVYGIFPSKI